MAAISHSPFRPGATALITGGASGIGLALAKHCIQTGMSVILVDIKTENLEKADEYLVKFVGNDKVDRVRCVMMDVGKLEEWELLKSSLRAGGMFSSILSFALPVMICCAFICASNQARKRAR
jgi:NAD(P)-dependent dehydrogenase (short-subunit alcohol dehydrogenase family)